MVLGSLFVVKNSGDQKITNDHIFLRISSKTLKTLVVLKYQMEASVAFQ